MVLPWTHDLFPDTEGAVIVPSPLNLFPHIAGDTAPGLTQVPVPGFRKLSQFIKTRPGPLMLK